MRLLSLCAILGVLTMASVGSADAAARPKPESYPALLTQVSHGEVRTAVLVPRTKVVRVRLKNGRRYRAKYTPVEKQRLLAALHAKHVHVAFAKPKKHQTNRIRRRYIALAVVVLGLLMATGWAFTRRRRGERQSWRAMKRPWDRQNRRILRDRRSGDGRGRAQ
jgi:ATP-dependent Zn protease